MPDVQGTEAGYADKTSGDIAEATRTLETYDVSFGLQSRYLLGVTVAFGDPYLDIPPPHSARHDMLMSDSTCDHRAQVGLVPIGIEAANVFRSIRRKALELRHGIGHDVVAVVENQSATEMHALRDGDIVVAVGEALCGPYYRNPVFLLDPLADVDSVA